MAIQSKQKGISEPAPESSIDRLFGSSERPVGDEIELVERVVAFVNGETNDETVRWRHAFAVAVQSGWSPRLDPDGEVDESDWNKNVGKFIYSTEVTQLVEHDRAAARQVLETAVKDPKGLVKWIIARLDRVGDSVGIVRRPIMHVVANKGLVITWRLEVEDMAAESGFRNALAYTAILLVMDYQRSCSDLGHCRLPGCGKFFMVKRGKPGKPRRDYCEDKHMNAAHAMNATQRSRMARASKKAEAAKPRHRRPS